LIDRIVVLAVVSGFVPATISAQKKPEPLPTGVTPAMVTQGKELFDGSGLCMACHGAEGRGSIGPKLSDSVWVHGTGTFPELVALILAGVSQEDSKSGSIMPPRGGSGLTDDEVKAIAAYVWTLSRSTTP
jgi:mono/diheme cytochrome c family protein